MSDEIKTKIIKKYVTSTGHTYELGDFYSGDQIITDFELSEDEKILTIWTGAEPHKGILRGGDYLVYADGSLKIVNIKSKYDRMDE